ncbi:hypothetical protein [Pseudodesulfovibrio tunisiensis]|uniref:hypothetical protein n=1 Tax=Pseudodesulfovibrio tunisiensis TaxID=463192 RepID=UPI001FB40F63|nr:hypothetical protein [Pseudodesulfovibrio tunisiensis]
MAVPNIVMLNPSELIEIKLETGKLYAKFPSEMKGLGERFIQRLQVASQNFLFRTANFLISNGDLHQVDHQTKKWWS